MIGRKFVFSDEQRVEVERRRARGQTFHQVAREMRLSYESLRRQFDEPYRLMRNESVRSARESIAPRFHKGLPGTVQKSFEAPPSVLAERARRFTLRRPSLTAEFFGDPLPGYSALDRMQRS